MDDPVYRSYVIRAWRRGSGDVARARVRIERVESGEQVDLDGPAAGALAAAVEEAIRLASRVAEPGESGEPGDDRAVGATGDQAESAARAGSRPFG